MCKSALGLLAFLSTGCIASSLLPSPSLSLGVELPPEEARAFQKALKAESGSRAFEQARINYLLERVSKSPYNFFRNGSRYTGKQAEAHLRWKQFRHQRKVKTAEDFIHHIASYSKMSGEPYFMVFPDKKRHPLGPLLVHELKLFDEALAKKHQAMAEQREAVNRQS